MVADVSVIDPPFLVTLGLLTAAVFIASWYPARHRVVRRGIRVLGVALTILTTAASLNARFEYLPTLATVFGKSAADQVSVGRLRTLEQQTANGPLQAESLGARGRGVVAPFVIPPTLSHVRARTGEVYLPPAYFATPRPSLPVIELLHGSPGSPVDWTRGAYADVTADRYADGHNGLAPIMVMPDVNGGWNTDSECVNGKRGRRETYLTRDVRAAVIKRFHARADRASWAIAGFSEGGYCAVQLGLRHPDLYGSVGDFSGETGPSHSGGMQALFSGSPSEIASRAARYSPGLILRERTGALKPSIWFEAGSLDPTLGNIEHLATLAEQRGFTIRVAAPPGQNHDFRDWRRAFADFLPWVAPRLLDASRAAVLGRA